MKERVVAYDILNVIACFSVIMFQHSGIAITMMAHKNGS